MEKSEAIQAVIEAGQTIRNHILLAEDSSNDELKSCMLQEIRAAAFQFKAAADYAVNNNDDNIGKKIISTEEGIKTLIDKSKQMNIDYRVNVFACYNNIRFVKKYVDSSGSSAADAFGWLLGDEDEKMKTLSMLKNLIGSNNGRDACFFLVAARKAGKITRPTYTTIKKTFPNIGAQSGYNKYFPVNPDNDDLFYSASEIEPIKNKF